MENARETSPTHAKCFIALGRLLLRNNSWRSAREQLVFYASIYLLCLKQRKWSTTKTVAFASKAKLVPKLLPFWVSSLVPFQSLETLLVFLYTAGPGSE